MPQGSVLGPLLWNIMFDEVLETEIPENTHTICYADDTIIVATGTNVRDLERRTNEATGIIVDTIERKSLEVALEKTEAVFFTRRREKKEPMLRIKDQRIKPGKCMKYLEVMVDKSLTYGEHISYAVNRATAVTAQLAQLMPDVEDPDQHAGGCS